MSYWTEFWKSSQDSEAGELGWRTAAGQTGLFSLVRLAVAVVAAIPAETTFSDMWGTNGKRFDTGRRCGRAGGEHAPGPNGRTGLHPPGSRGRSGVRNGRSPVPGAARTVAADGPRSAGAPLALAGSWERTRPVVAGDDDVELLARLHAEIGTPLRAPPAATTAVHRHRQALKGLIGSLETFNRRWVRHVPTVDLSAANRAREEYNRYYLLEKECAVGAARSARDGFRLLEPLTVSDLTAAIPPLGVPRPAPGGWAW